MAKTIWFVSDTHFGHANMLGFENPDGSPVRKFGTVEEMDEAIIEGWNSVVKDNDKVYHLGDVAIPRKSLHLVKRCNGRKRLIRGNHDIYSTKDYLTYFEEIHGTRVLDNFLFTHCPSHIASVERFEANVHGHIHYDARLGPKWFNVTVEVLQYRPISFEEIKEAVAVQQGKSSLAAKLALGVLGK